MRNITIITSFVTLIGYKNIDSSFPERIMKEFEKNSDHYRKGEERAQKYAIERDIRGQWMAFILSLCLMAIIFLF